jgi:hypothetical protein
MNINTAVVNRLATVLFNFWLKKQQNDKRIGDLTMEDFVEMCGIVNFIGEQGDKRDLRSNTTNSISNNQEKKG